MSYYDWKSTLKGSTYADTQVIIKLVVTTEMETEESRCVSGNSIPWTSRSVEKVSVIVAQPPREYCGKVVVLEDHKLGYYSEDSYREGKALFASLVEKHIKGENHEQY